MAIGPNSKWRCNKDCTCPQSRNGFQHRCNIKREMVARAENLPPFMMRLLYRLDLYEGNMEVRSYNHWRTVIKDWLWREDESSQTR